MICCLISGRLYLQFSPEGLCKPPGLNLDSILGGMDEVWGGFWRSKFMFLVWRKRKSGVSGLQKATKFTETDRKWPTTLLPVTAPEMIHQPLMPATTPLSRLGGGRKHYYLPSTWDLYTQDFLHKLQSLETVTVCVGIDWNPLIGSRRTTNM